MADLKAQFEKAQKDVKTLAKRPSNEDLLYLYAHYKQAVDGDVSGSRPGMMDLVGRAKYDAWAKLKGQTADEAMKMYVAKVKVLLAGTVVRCTAVYDNAAANPANPDPAATVRAGEQSWDEMFNGYFDVALADQDLVAEGAAAAAVRLRAGAFGLAAGLGVVLFGRRAFRRPGG